MQRAPVEVVSRTGVGVVPSQIHEHPRVGLSPAPGLDQRDVGGGEVLDHLDRAFGVIVAAVDAGPVGDGVAVPEVDSPRTLKPAPRSVGHSKQPHSARINEPSIRGVQSPCGAALRRRRRGKREAESEQRKAGTD